MKFNTIINEAGAGIATTADFWTKSGVDSGQFVRLNGKIITLRQFLILSEKDSDVKKIIQKIKQSPDYRGSVGDFIANLLKDDDGIIDISVRDKGVYFDKHEIDKNKENTKDVSLKNTKKRSVLHDKLGWKF